MPLTPKGEKILRAMKAEYGEKEGERNFYASRNAGRISGVDNASVKSFPSRELARIPAGTNPTEAHRQTRELLAGRYVPGRDRAKLKGGR